MHFNILEFDLTVISLRSLILKSSIIIFPESDNWRRKEPDYDQRPD